jgi:hypothetical protein
MMKSGKANGTKRYKKSASKKPHVDSQADRVERFAKDFVKRNGELMRLLAE